MGGHCETYEGGMSSPAMQIPLLGLRVTVRRSDVFARELATETYSTRMESFGLLYQKFTDSELGGTLPEDAKSATKYLRTNER